MNIEDVINQGVINTVFKVKTIGIIIIISISKIKKITAIKKKWIENGNRLFDIGLKPHSKGLDFWLSTIDFFEIIIIKIIIIKAIIIIINKWIKIKLIIYFRNETFKLEA